MLLSLPSTYGIVLLRRASSRPHSVPRRMRDPPALYDLFISYAHCEAAAVRPLVRALNQAGLRIWMDERNIEDFHGITSSIVDGLASSKALVAYYSDTYPTRRACQWELTAAFLAGQHAGDVRKRVLVLNPETDAGHIHPIELRDALYTAVPSEVDESWLEGTVARLRTHSAEISGALGDIRSLAPPPWYGTSAGGSTRFAGRLPELWQVHSALRSADVPVITNVVGTRATQIRGLGGCGKSLLAEEYALRYGAGYPGGVFWLRAYGQDGSQASLTPEQREVERLEQLRSFAERMGLPANSYGPEEVEGMLARAIEARGAACLWIVDDVPAGLGAPELRRWFAPHPLARTLLTTRSREYGALATPVDLPMLEPEAGYRLLTSRRAPESDAERSAARKIVAALGGHALALDVAGAALGASEGLLSFEEFSTSIDGPGGETLEFAARLLEALPTGHERSVIQTLIRSIEQLGEEGRDFLLLASSLAVAPLPPSFVAAVLARCDGIPEERSKQKTLMALHAVDTLSLADPVTGGRGNRTVHSLVASATRQWDSRNTASASRMRQFLTRAARSLGVPIDRCSRLRSAAIETLIDQIEGLNTKHTIVELVPLLPHARELIIAPESRLEINLIGSIARFDSVRGAHASAEQLCRLQLEIARRKLGEDDARTLQSLDDLATALALAGKTDEARTVREQLIERSTRVFGAENSNTLMYQVSGFASLQPGEWQPEHRALAERYFAIARAQARDGSEELAEMMTAHGRFLHISGDSAAARTTLEQAHEILAHLQSERIHDLREALAIVLVEQGQAAHGEQLLGEAFVAYRQRYGLAHAITFRCMRLLAVARREAGDLEGATDLLGEALTTSRQEFGPDHPDTLQFAQELAVVLRMRGDVERAHPLILEVLTRRRQLLGDQHAETIRSALSLHRILLAKGEDSGAAEIFEQFLASVATSEPEALRGELRQIRSMILEDGKPEKSAPSGRRC
jgi:hypothetical protein